MMHVGLTTYYYRRRGGGGVYTHVDALRRHLRAQGHKVTVLAHVPQEFNVPPEAMEGVHPVSVAPESRTLGVFHAAMRHAARRAEAACRTDLLHTHNTAGLWPILDVPDRPAVCTLHNLAVDVAGSPGLDARWRRWREGALLRCTTDTVDRVVVVSDKLRDLAAGLGAPLPASRTLMIPPGIDTTRYAPGDRADARRQLGFDAATVVLTVQRMTPRKGATDLLDAAAAWRPEDGRLQVQVIGDGPAAVAFDRAVVQRGLGAVVARRNHVEPHELVTYYRAADALVNTTHESEAYGMVTAEAIACGVPVVCTPEAADTGVVPRDDLWVYRDTAELLRHLTMLRTAPDRARERVAAARGHVVSCDAVMGRVEALYATLMTQPRSRRRAPGMARARVKAILGLSDLLYRWHARARRA